jgi:mRNA-degrading endonuclease RelE of RelBE toxin-antitoxin system
MWKVKLHCKVQKALRRLPQSVYDSFSALVLDIQDGGPVRGDWPNYSKLRGARHHCHIMKGKPTYVAVWQVGKNEISIVEVIYVGTHEGAPY